MVPAKLQETPSTALIPAPAGGFGKVINSLHGLQQRLDDFSVEEVIETASTAERLIGDLAFLQIKLAGTLALKKILLDEHRFVDEVPNPDFIVVPLSNLQNYPALSAILIAGHELREAVLACPVSAPKSPITEPSAPPPPRSMVGGSPNTEAVKATSIAPTEDHKGKAKTLHAESKPTPAQPKPKANTSGKQSSAQGKGEFDQRLLDDLIKTYGDFATSPTSRALVKTPPPPVVKEKPKAERTDTSPPTTALTVISSDSVKPSETPKPKPEPAKTSPAEIIPILETGPANEAAANAKNSTKQGDIDRQLKRIVKDYGEYDLYPRNNSLNVKVAGMVAFALLGLVLALFYVFKAPAPITTAPAGSSPGVSNQSSGETTNHGKEKK